MAAARMKTIKETAREVPVDSEGIGVELEQRAKAMGATSPEVQSKSEAINADMFKVVADRIVAEAKEWTLFGVPGEAPVLVLDRVLSDVLQKTGPVDAGEDSRPGSKRRGCARSG